MNAFVDNTFLPNNVPCGSGDYLNLIFTFQFKVSFAGKPA